ncbi:MAG: hypothetical protein B7Y90_13270 [Alphaproteobacteria bacterium 32-64-14]|nr:MAG: hypothetical protein B7Y90_13270 [Alphaproteobacteria bacterium 32-64-14]
MRLRRALEFHRHVELPAAMATSNVSVVPSLVTFCVGIAMPGACVGLSAVAVSAPAASFVTLRLRGMSASGAFTNPVHLPTASSAQAALEPNSATAIPAAANIPLGRFMFALPCAMAEPKPDSMPGTQPPPAPETM